MAGKSIIIMIIMSLLLSVLSPFCCFNASAAESPTEPFLLPNSDIMLSGLDLITDDFNSAILSWNIIGGEGEPLRDFPSAPYTPFEGTRSLAVTPSEENVTLSRDIQDGADSQAASAMVCYSLAVWVPAATSGATLTLSLSATHGSFEGKSKLTSGTWQAVVFDLSPAELSGELEAVEITLEGLTPNEKLYLDLMGGSSSSDFENRLKFMSSSLVGSSGVQITDAAFSSGDEQYVESLTPSFTDFSDSFRGIRVRLKSSGAASRLTLGYVTNDEKNFSEQISVEGELSGYGEILSCLFPIHSESITAFRLYFSGDEEIEILSITPALCYAEKAGVGQIISCTVGGSGKTVTASATLPREVAERYAEGTVCLYEIPAGGDVSSITALSTPISDTEAAESMSVTFRLSQDKRELYSRYVMMLFHKDKETQKTSLIQIGKPFSVTNPELLAQSDKPFALSSKKGIYPASSLSPLDGVSVTAVNIPLDRLLTAEGEGDSIAGGLCKINTEYLRELDSLMLQYRSSKIAVYFILTVSVSGNASLDSLLVHPSAESNAEGYTAFNTESEDGIKALAAASEFLAGRYCLSKGIAPVCRGFTVGTQINDRGLYYNMGSAGFTEFMESYCTAFRTVYSAVRSVCSGVDVCLPLGGVWYSYSDSCDSLGGYDARLCLEAVSACLGGAGEIDFAVSYNPCLAQKGIYSYQENSPLCSASGETYYISASNLEVLLHELSRAENLYRGTQRDVILLEAMPHAPLDQNEEIKLSAEYIYTYLRISSRSLSGIKAYIPSHGASYENTLSLVDTQRLSELTGSYFSELVGEERCKQLVSDAIGAVTRYAREKELLSSAPSEIKGRTVLLSFDSSLSGFTPQLGCEALKFGASLGDRSGLLSVMLGDHSSTLRGISCSFDGSYDFSQAPYIHLDIQATSLPPQVRYVGVAVVLFSGNSYCMSKNTVPVGQWASLICDLRDFELSRSCDRMAIYIYSADGEDIGQPTLLIDSVSVMSPELSSEDILSKLTSGQKGQPESVGINKIILLSALALICLIMLTARAVNRRKKRTVTDSSEFIPPDFGE